LSSSKIGREIFGFGKNLFWKLVPCIEVTLVSKFHLIWCPIAEEPFWEESGGFWEKIAFPETSCRTMSDLTQTMSDL
jgi:hypothetical protein